MSEHVHDWVRDASADIPGMFRCACGKREFGDLCKPGELTAERAKVAELERKVSAYENSETMIALIERLESTDAALKLTTAEKEYQRKYANEHHARAEAAEAKVAELESRVVELEVAMTARAVMIASAEAKVARLREAALQSIAALICHDIGGAHSLLTNAIVDTREALKEVQR